MTFLIALTMIMVGIWSPVVSVILLTVGIFFSWTLGFFFLSPGMIFLFIIIMGISLYRLSQ